MTIDHVGGVCVPSPAELASAAEAMPRVARCCPAAVVARYVATMVVLTSRGYSHAQVAAWMTDRVGVTVTRAQVHYALRREVTS